MKTMKMMILGSFVAIAALTTGCENYKDELAQMTSTKDSLLAVSSTKDKSIEEFITSFDEIEGNLAEITTKQDAVKVETVDKTEMNVNAKERIRAEIASIKQLIEEMFSQGRNKHEVAKMLKNAITECNSMVN